MREPLIIVGASARAAAQSAVRAGLAPHAADLFGDFDLRQTCPTEQVAHYPQGLAAACASFPPGPWIYTGALENQPDLIDRLAAVRPLLGNSGSILRQVRDPLLVAQALEQASLPCPRVSKLAPASDGRSTVWLRKPLASAGGGRISVWAGQGQGSCSDPGSSKAAANRPANDERNWYWQERIEGLSAAAVFVAAGGRAVFLGATRQLSGEPWTGASPFGYAGSVGPLILSPQQQQAFIAIGNCLAARFDLRGLFGVDAILNTQGVWPVEVNPRYTASIEVLERALGQNFLACHVAACRENRLPGEIYSCSTAQDIFCGKAILYAERTFEMPKAVVEQMLAANAGQSWPRYADIPMPASRIEAGWPIVTVLASGQSDADVLRRLRELGEEGIADCSFQFAN